MKDDAWPKLADVFPGKARTEGSAEQRFRAAGFDLSLTLREQSPPGRGDKNNEGQQPQLFRGAATTMENETTSESTRNAAKMYEKAEELRAAGMTVGIPMVIQLDDSVLRAMRRGAEPMPFGQEIARFSTKAVIGGVVLLVVGVTYHYVTAPPAMDGMA